MTALVAGDVTVTIERREIVGKLRRNRVKIQFGDSSLTIPSGGVPMPAASAFGMKQRLDYLTVYDSNDASGIMWKYDATNNKLRAWVAPAQTHTHNLLLKNAAVADSAGARVNAGANLLGANTGGDLTVTGGGANGGVVSTTLGAAASTEDVSSAIAAQVFFAEAVGW